MKTLRVVIKLKVRIGSVTIPDAQVKRFIDLQSGLALSMIQVSYIDKEEIKHGELIEAFKNNTLLPFDCEILKTKVLVHGFGYNKETKERKFTLQERGADVSCGYKLVDWRQPTQDETMVFIIPEDVKDLIRPEKLRTLSHIRFILKKDIPKEWFE